MKMKVLVVVAVGWSVLAVGQAVIGLSSVYAGRDHRYSAVMALLSLILANQTWAMVRNSR